MVPLMFGIVGLGERKRRFDMKRIILAQVGLTMLAVTLGLAQDTKHILIDGELEDGFDLGLNTNKGRTDWLKNDEKLLRLTYPSEQRSGYLFITVGPPKDPPRPFIDLSQFGFLVVEMRGGVGGEKVQIGIKTNTQKDNGGETKLDETLSSEWKTYRYALGRFLGADPAKLYVVAEFVFTGPESKTIYVKSIRYTK
jgi:hypothetical protein